MNLLLLSNSTSPNGYLVDALPAIAELTAGRKRAVFAPFASIVRSWDETTQRVRDALAPLALDITALHQAADPVAACADAEVVIVGGGNTFHLLHHCRKLGLLPALRGAVERGAAYLGWSAGANLAGPSIRTTNDMPVTDPQGLDALGLVPLQINPHYSNVVPEGIHGETRNERIAEFTRVWPLVHVLGLPEGTWLRVQGSERQLGGPHDCWWFSASDAPRALPAGSALPI